MWETSFPFCACKRDCVGKAASLAGKDSVEAAFGRLGKRCDFLSDQKVTKESPGNGSEERLRAAGAPSRLFPGPLVTRVGPFGLLVIPGGQNQVLFPFYSQALGPFAIKI